MRYGGARLTRIAGVNLLLWGLLGPVMLAQTFQSEGMVLPGSVRNEMRIHVANDTRAQLVGLRVRAVEIPPSILNLTIEPGRIDALDHDRSAAFTILFDVAGSAAAGELAPVRFEVSDALGRMQPTQAELRLTVTPAPALTACAIRADAPENFEPRDAINYCDPDRGPHEYDRVAVFFTPPRDLSEPIRDRPPFHWRIVGPNGAAVPLRGSMYGTWAAFAPKLEERRSTAFAKAGSPGRFAAVVDLWNRRDHRDPAAASRGPGTYKVQTMQAEYGAEGTLGQGEANTVRARLGAREDGSPLYADWEDVASFDVASSRLHFQGFVMESVNNIWIPDRDDIWEGKLTVDSPQVAGSTVTLGARAWVRKARRDGTGRRPDDQVHRAGTRVTIEFPKELAPGHEEMGEIRARVEPVEKGAYLLTAGMHLMIPTSGLPPGRHLVLGDAFPAPWAAYGTLPESYCQSVTSRQERFLTKGSGDGVWMWSRKPPPAGCEAREPTELDARTVLLAGLPGQVAGSPARSLQGHLQDASSRWIIPVFLDLTDEAKVRDYARTLEMKTYGYAIYAAKPGIYNGPPPRGGPPAGDGPDPASRIGVRGEPPDRARPDPARPDPVRTEPIRPDVSAAVPPADPAALDPASPGIAALIREWLGVAEPVENAGGASFRYDRWGRLVGSAAPGMGRTAGEQPPPEGGGVPEAYAWRQRSKLDSIDHCTLEEYVVARVRQSSTGHCAGRYPRGVSVPDVRGMPLADAVGLLRQQSLEVKPALLGPAPRRELAGSVAAQRPPSSARLPRGATVEVDVHGEFRQSGVGVPDLRGLTLSDAQQRLSNAGLVMQPSLRGPAPDAARAERVETQKPAPGTTVSSGAAVEVELWGKYSPPATVRADPAAPPSDIVLTGHPNIQCPASFSGGPLMQGSGYSTQPEYGYLRCEWQNPGSTISTIAEVTWYTSANSSGENFCGAEDVINDRQSPNWAYQPDARFHSKSRKVQVRIRWHDPREREWIFNLMRSYIAAVEPYAQPCARGTTEGILQGVPNMPCPAGIGGGTLNQARSGRQAQLGYYSVFDCAYSWPDGSLSVVWRINWAHRDVPQAYTWCRMPDNESGTESRRSLLLHNRDHAIQIVTDWNVSWGREQVLGVTRALMKTFAPYTVPCRGGPP